MAQSSSVILYCRAEQYNMLGPRNAGTTAWPATSLLCAGTMRWANTMTTLVVMDASDSSIN